MLHKFAIIKVIIINSLVKLENLKLVEATTNYTSHSCKLLSSI